MLETVVLVGGAGGWCWWVVLVGGAGGKSRGGVIDVAGATAESQPFRPDFPAWSERLGGLRTYANWQRKAPV